MLKLQGLSTFLKRLSGREKIVFYAAVFIVSLMTFDRFIISPIFTKMDSLNTETEEKEASVRKNLRIISHEERIIAEKAKYGGFLKSFNTEEEEITALLKEIEALASKSSIYLVDMKPRGLKTTGAASKYVISLNCEAQMEQIMEFMYYIENSKRLLTIDRYEISPKSRESSIASCSMSISKLILPE